MMNVYAALFYTIYRAYDCIVTQTQTKTTIKKYYKSVIYGIYEHLILVDKKKLVDKKMVN